MRKQYTALEVLFPKVRAELLRLLFRSGTDQRYVRELMMKSELALSTVQQELARLSALGLIEMSSKGYRRFYRANRKHPFFPLLMQLVHYSGQLPPVEESKINSRGPSAARRKKRKLARLRPEKMRRIGSLR